MKTERRHEMGEGGFCICPKCNNRAEHNHGIPCQDEKCSECGAKMIREDSHHHELLLKKQKKNSEDG